MLISDIYEPNDFSCRDTIRNFIKDFNITYKFIKK